MGDVVEKWRTLSRRVVAERRVFSVLEAEMEGPGGRRGRFDLLEAPDWATVVPLVEGPDGAGFLMVRQYRHGSDELCVEFPGGVVERGEDPAAAAERELEEETGYRAGRIRLAGTVSPNPAIMTNRFHVFVADRLEPNGRVSLDEHEVVDAFVVPVAEVRARMGTEPYTHALMAAALLMAERVIAAE